MMRSTQWARLRERRIADGSMAEGDGWCHILRDSAFQGFGAAGPLARWWEDNAWYPLSELRSGRSARPEEPVPFHVEASLGVLVPDAGQHTPLLALLDTLAPAGRRQQGQRSGDQQPP